MRILLLSHLFNGLTQRLFVELRAAGHVVAVEYDIADSVTEEAVALWRPELVIAPFLKRRIPESVWSRVLCLVVHPGPPGDRGPSALDWALQRGERDGGVTVLQATAEFDAGPVWAWRPIVLRAGATKADIYRRDVTQAAVAAVFDALARFRPGLAAPQPAPQLPPRLGVWQPLMRQTDRAIDWLQDDSATVLRKLRAADGFPGVADALFGLPCRLFDAHAACTDDLAHAPAGAPGAPIARRGPALLLRTLDGGVWIGHVRRATAEADTLKLAATRAFAAEATGLPELPVPLERPAGQWDELRYREFGPVGARVGVLSFEFYNGAMSTRQCLRLAAALDELRARDTRVLVLDGGAECFSNGIHLHDIEAATLDGASAADASMRNIEAIDEVAHEILTLTDRLTVALLRGNAGAGGCFLALAADEVWACEGVVLNPHYKNMGNLHGSEYWTYTLPRRVGAARAAELMQARLPLLAAQACQLGLVDLVLGADAPQQAADAEAAARAAAHNVEERIAAKQARRAEDEARKPLAAYRTEELQRMHRNFYGFDPSYHVARHHFVYRKPQAWTPRHLAVHREAPRR
ncbi:MAG TPA: enoyl-CoA hydratase-related protein [Methylibium sp.]|nr:enoyl-CoA hydratase-related protein [Methylibium sp.]